MPNQELALHPMSSYSIHFEVYHWKAGQETYLSCCLSQEEVLSLYKPETKDKNV